MNPLTVTGSEPAPPLGRRRPLDEWLKGAFKRALTYIGPRGDRPLGRNKSVFNSGGEEAFDAVMEYVRPRGLSGFGEAFSGFDEGVLVSQRRDQDYMECLSAAFARRSSGEVFVFLPKDGLTSDTMFSTTEWEELMANGSITQITWISPEDESVTSIIWKSGDARGPFPMNEPPSNMRD